TRSSRISFSLGTEARSQFISADRNLGRRCESQPHLFSTDSQYGQPNVFANDDDLARLTTQNQHVQYSFGCNTRICSSSPSERFAQHLAKRVNNVGRGNRFSKNPGDAHLQQAFDRVWKRIASHKTATDARALPP